MLQNYASFIAKNCNKNYCLLYNMLKIKEIRESKNLSQDEIVALTGIAKRSYLNYEYGKTDIPFSKLQNIASALKVKIQDFIDKDVQELDLKENAELLEMHQDLKKEFGSLRKELKDGIDTLSDALFHLLKEQQNLIKFIGKLDPDEINEATKNLNKWLEDHKE